MDTLFPEYWAAMKIIDEIRYDWGKPGEGGVNLGWTPAEIYSTSEILDSVETYFVAQRQRVRQIQNCIFEKYQAMKEIKVEFEARVLARGCRVDQISPGMNWEVDTELGTESQYFDKQYLEQMSRVKWCIKILNEKMSQEAFIATMICDTVKRFATKSTLEEREAEHWLENINVCAFQSKGDAISTNCEEPKTTKDSETTEEPNTTEDSKTSKEQRRLFKPDNCEAGPSQDRDLQHMVVYPGNESLPTQIPQNSTFAKTLEKNPKTKDENIRPDPCSLCGWLNHNSKNCWKIRTGQVKRAAKPSTPDDGSSFSLVQNQASATNTLPTQKPNIFKPSDIGNRASCSYCHKVGHVASHCWEQYPLQRPGMNETARNTGWAKPIGKRNGMAPCYVDERSQEEKDRARRKAGWSEKWTGDVRGPNESDDSSWDNVVRWDC